MTDDGTLPDRLRNMVRNPNAIGTHSAACWQWHDDCALLLAADRVAERAARERAEAEARQLREAIRAHENLHRPDGPDGADGPIEMDGWPCCNDDRLLWAAAVAEVAEDRGQTDG